MNYQDVILNREKGWVEITINRPEKLNSLREQTADEILAILNEVEHDRDVRAVILLGSEKAFCTGIDTSEFQIKENGYFDFYRFRKRSPEGESAVQGHRRFHQAADIRHRRVSRWAAGWSWHWSATSSSPARTPSSVCPRSSSE